MPSWNIHIAQTEQLFKRAGALACTVRDQNAFLFGALIPDIPVGYMVPGIKDPIAYRITHFAKPACIPKPREWEFWDTYVAPLVRSDDVAAAWRSEGDDGPQTGVIPASSIKLEGDRVSRVHFPKKYEHAPAPAVQASPLDGQTASDVLSGSIFDLVLGAWSHLVADSIWNTRVNEYLDAIGGVPSEQFRIRKQGDFDAFGKTLPIELVPRPTPRLVATASAFPQYAIDERQVLMSVGVAHEIVRTNVAPAEPYRYRLLTDEFFDRTFTEVVEATDRLLVERCPMFAVA